MAMSPPMCAGAPPAGASSISAPRSNTSKSRSLATAARWKRLTMKPATRNGCATMLTYRKKAVNSPTVISPASTRWPP